ncbi:hypothetical protein BASA81_000798 [Batrachochytrium salamandrivorans]|nr:hypothetical protein BASA81_000798 [Batrachochytrium salamandrivorans]
MLQAISSSRNLIRSLLEEVHASGVQVDIDLSLGDPTAYGDPYNAFPGFTKALIASASVSGYSSATGNSKAKLAIANQYGTSPDNVIITPGCSMALDMIFRSLCEVGDSVLVPAPGFPLYETLLGMNRITAQRYKLLPAAEWNVDLESFAQVENKLAVKAVVVSNPNNPTGSVYSLQHLRDIVYEVKRNFPNAVIVADQIYEDVVFAGEFVDLGPLGQAAGVPTVTASGLSKGFHCPGWRMGWMVLFGTHQEFKQRVCNLAGTNMGASTGIQLAAQICFTTERLAYEQFRHAANALLRETAEIFANGLQNVKGGVDMCKPRGAMYLFFKFRASRNHQSSLDICRKLVNQHGVLLLPGDACFHSPQGYLRVFIAVPPVVAKSALAKILRFAAEEF